MKMMGSDEALWTISNWAPLAALLQSRLGLLGPILCTWEIHLIDHHPKDAW